MAENVRSIEERNGGCGAIVDEKLYVWGGEGLDREILGGGSESESDEEEEEEEEEIVIETVVTLPRPSDEKHPFDVYDLRTHTWTRQSTHGDVPTVGLGSSLVYYSENCADHESRSLYLYGGWNDGHFSDDVYAVSLDTWQWRIVQPTTDVKPSARYLTGVIVHKGRLCIFGGVGLQIKSGQDPGASFVFTVQQGGIQAHYGWSNEYYEFDLKHRSWTAPLGKDATRPGPIGTFAFARCDEQHAMLYGGSGPSGRMNEAFIFHLDNRQWQRKPCGSQPWPRPLRFPTLTPLSNPNMVGQQWHEYGPTVTQTMLLLWGKDTPQHICEEAWLLDVEAFAWTKLDIGLKPRSWYIAQPIYSRISTGCQVAIFGGNVHVRPSLADRINTADIQILKFGVQSLVELSSAAIAGSELLMKQVSSLPPTMHCQIQDMHSALKNGPPSPPITISPTP